MQWQVVRIPGTATYSRITVSADRSRKRHKIEAPDYGVRGLFYGQLAGWTDYRQCHGCSMYPKESWCMTNWSASSSVQNSESIFNKKRLSYDRTGDKTSFSLESRHMMIYPSKECFTTMPS